MIKSIIFIILCVVGFIFVVIFLRRFLNHWRYERSQTLSIIVDLTIITLSILAILFFGFCLIKNITADNSRSNSEKKTTTSSTTTTVSSVVSTTTSYSTSLTLSNTTVPSYKTRTIKTTATTTPKIKKSTTVKHTIATTSTYTPSAYTAAPKPVQTTKRIATTTTEKTTKKKKTVKTTKVKRITTTNITTTSYVAENAYSSELLSLVNKYRKSSGLTRLKPMIELDKIAYQRAKEIAESYSHTRPNGNLAQSILKNYGLSYSYFGENLGAGSKSSEQVFKEWRYSPVNNANILNSNYKYVGSACYYYPDDPSGRHFYWVQVFYTP